MSDDIPPETVALFAAYLEDHGCWGPLWPAFNSDLTPEAIDRLGEDAARSGDHPARLLAALLADMTPKQRAALPYLIAEA